MFKILHVVATTGVLTAEDKRMRMTTEWVRDNGRQTTTNYWVQHRKMMEQMADNKSGWSEGGDGRQTTDNNHKCGWRSATRAM